MPSAGLSLTQHLSKFSQQNKLWWWGIVHLQALYVYETQLKVTYHVIGLLLAGLVAPGWYTVVSMSVTKATAFDNKIIDGIMVCGEDGSTGMFGLAGTRLALQQADSQVGDHELVLCSWSIGIHLVPRGQGSIDHLEIEGEENLSKSVIPPVKKTFRTREKKKRILE